MTQAPSFQVAAAVSGRDVSNASLQGKRAVLVLHGPKTADAAKEVGKAVRAKFPLATDVVVANIVDLRSMGGLWKKVAEAQVKSTYNKLAERIQASGTGLDPADYVVICPDWEGSIAPRFGVEAPDAEAAVVVLDAQGKVAAKLGGKDLGPQTLAALASPA